MGKLHLCFTLLFSSILLVSGDIAHFLIKLNSTVIESSAPVASPSSFESLDSRLDFGNASMIVYFNGDSSANVILTVYLNNFPNVDQVLIYKGDSNTARGGIPVYNITSDISLTALNSQNPSNLSFSAGKTGVIDLDAVFADPTNYYIVFSNSNDAIRGQFEDSTPGFTPQGFPDVSSDQILTATLTFLNPPLQYQETNYYNSVFQLFFITLNESSYNAEFYITSYVNDTSSVELYEIKSNNTLFDFSKEIRFPSLDDNYKYRGSIESFSHSLSKQLLSSPSSYGLRMTTTLNGTKLILAGELASITAFIPPPPQDFSPPSDFPPMSVDTGDAIGVDGSPSMAPSILASPQNVLVPFLVSGMLLLQLLLL